ncbi:hypothetical protein [Nocardia sp. X0981]
MTTAVEDPAATESGWRYAPPVRAVLGPVLIAVLVVDAVISLIFEVLSLPLYIGAVPVPIAALLAAPVNLALVWAAATVTGRLSALFLPLAAWLVAFLIAAGRGPGGDVPLRGDLPTLLLFICGVVPPLTYMYVVANRPRSAQRR